MRQTHLLPMWAALLAALWGPTTLAEEWVRIVPDAFEHPPGSGTVLEPSCAGGLKSDADLGLVPADPEFSYFVREGDQSDKWLIALDGGGACWDWFTCVGSVVAGEAVYEQEVTETTDSLQEAGGIGDIDDPDNPLSEYTQVFIPYCTGDIHWGSNDERYTNEAIPGLPSWIVRHRGFVNLLAVLNDLSARSPTEIVVVGASAGGYGALLALPEIKQHWPLARTHLLSDSANGVISADFYDRALGGPDLTGGVWGIEDNVPGFLVSALASGPDNLAVATYTTLAWRYSLTRFGQYTRAWDSTQISFYHVGKHVDQPQRWEDPAFLIPSIFEWTIKARQYMGLTALYAPVNYRFYIGAGDEHTILVDEAFYTESSAEGIFFRDWVDDMVNRRLPWAGDWRNVSCAPSCLP